MQPSNRQSGRRRCRRPLYSRVEYARLLRHDEKHDSIMLYHRTQHTTIVTDVAKATSVIAVQDRISDHSAIALGDPRDRVRDHPSDHPRRPTVTPNDLRSDPPDGRN